MTSAPHSSARPSANSARAPLDTLRACFERDGFLRFDSVVDRARLSELSSQLVAQFKSERAAGRLFRGGGTLNGHLNCFPGAASRFVYDALEDAGVLGVVRAFAGERPRLPNIGCNLNLPGSHEQNEHVDGYAQEPFLIVNVAAVDTDLVNGAMEIFPGSHQRPYQLWEILLGGPNRRRVPMRQGDALIRTSALWHRGMPNRSQTPRPMLAFTWENGGSDQQDPYLVHGGQITFLPNRFNTNWKGRLVERAFVAAPRLSTACRAALSFFDNRLL